MTTIKIDSMFVLRDSLGEDHDLRDFSAYAIVSGYFGYEQYRNRRPFQTVVAGICDRLGIGDDGRPEVIIKYAAAHEHESIKKYFREAGFVEPIHIWEAPRRAILND